MDDIEKIRAVDSSYVQAIATFYEARAAVAEQIEERGRASAEQIQRLDDARVILEAARNAYFRFH